jgi:hypothetical protein
MRERGSLRDGGQRHPRQRNTDRRAYDERDDDPGVADDLGMKERSDDGGRHPADAGRDALPRRFRRAEPPQREDEEDGGDEIRGLRQVIDRRHC